MIKTKLVLLLCFFAIISCKENKTEAQELKKPAILSEKVSATRFKEKIEKREVQLIDVRTPEEYTEGHIKNAANINLFDKDFVAQIDDKLDKNKPVFLYCKAGSRSSKVVTKLKELGFKEIYDLEGGILDWKNNDFEIVK